MAAIPYASASSRPVPTINIPFRSIISSSSSSSTHQRTPSPAASPSTPPTSGSSNRASAFFTGQFTSSSSSPAPSPPAASSSNRNSLVFLQSQQPPPPQQQSQQELQPHPMLYSAGRRSRRAARGLEISSGGRRTGGRDIDDMTDDELRAHLHHRTRLHSDDDVLPSRQASPAPPPPAATAAPSANNRTLSPLSGNIIPNIPVSNGRTSSSSDLPAYFVDPSLPQYEYRARPVWPVYSSDSAGIPSTSSFFFTGGVQITPPPPPPPMADEVTCALLTASPLTSSPVDERTGMGGASMVRPTPFPTSSSTPGLPSTPERRILGLPNRNSPPVPPRSLPNTSGLSVLRGSSLLHTNAAAAARSLGSSSLGMTGVPVGGRSSVVSETEGTVALPPPAYEEQDSARRGSAPCPLGEPRSAAMVGSTIAIQPSASIPAAAATPVPMPMSTATPTGGSPLGSSPSLPSVIPVPPVPTRSVSLPGANASMASAAATATAIVRNRQLQQQGVTPASSIVTTSVPLGAGLGEGEGEGEVMMEEVILTPCTTPTSSANPRTPASEMNRQTALPSPPPSATFSRPSPPTTTITNRRPISQVIVRQYATVGASPSQSSGSGSGSAWGMCGAGLSGYSVDDSQTEFRFGVQHGRSAENNNNNNGGGGVVMVRPPIPSERRSSRAVGRHMRAATSVLPSVTSHGQGQGGRGVVASGGATATVPARQQGVRNRPPLSMSIFDPSSSAPAPAPAQTQTHTEVSSSSSTPSPSPSPASASQAQAQAQAVAAAAMFGLTAREWSLRLAWLGEQEGDGVLSAGSGPGGAARRSASISAS